MQLSQRSHEQLVGGMIEVSSTDDMVAIKTRLLSSGASFKRIARIDNIKDHRFDWADLEGLITSPVISGRQLYAGEGTRPNTLIWTLTLNSTSLSRDMARRCIIVRLQRPINNPNWMQETHQFISTHKWQIIADIGQVFQTHHCGGHHA